MSQQVFSNPEAAAVVSHVHRAARRVSMALAAVALSLLSVACGSDEPTETSGESKDELGARPCSVAPNSGYPGDEFCIEAPPAGKGFQMHYGPKNYDDKAEVAKYLLAPGEEITDCLYMKTPNDTGVFMNQYHARMRPGSHHMITYTMAEEHPDSTAPEDCGFGLWRFLVGSQESKIDIKNAEQAPELEHAAMYIAPKLQAAVQVHFVNTSTTEYKLKEAWVNAVLTDESNVEVRIEPIFWLGGLRTVTRARSSNVVKGRCRTAKWTKSSTASMRRSPPWMRGALGPGSK